MGKRYAEARSLRDQLRRRNERVTEQYMVQVRSWLPVSKSCSQTRVIASGDARHALAIAAAKDQADIIAIAPGDDVEIRRVTLLNESGRTREIDLTSYTEVVLAPAAHERHPAFSKLFVHSERLAEPGALIFTRRPQRPADRPPVLAHRLVAEDPAVTSGGLETDRRAFLSRHGNSEHPPGATDVLVGGAKWTLDPVMTLRVRIRLAPEPGHNSPS